MDIFEAIENNDIEKFKLLLNKINSKNINIRDENGMTLLHISCLKNNFEITELLLKNGADVNAENNKYETPLHLITASIIDGAMITELLIKNGADINAKNNFGYTSLHISCLKNYLEKTKRLIDYGADVNIKDDYQENTPLHFSCHKTNYEITELLIKNGANVNSQNRKLETPLYRLCLISCYKLSELVLPSGSEDIADGKITFIQNGNIDQTVTYYYLYGNLYNSNFYKISQLLMKNGADINLKEENGITVLHEEARSLCELCDNNDRIDYILQNSTNIDVIDNNGLTPLHYSCRYGLHKKIKRLLEKGANVNALTNDLYTPLHELCQYLNDRRRPLMLNESVQILIEYGANLNAKNKYGFTPLYMICFRENYITTKLLLHYMDISSITNDTLLLELLVKIKTNTKIIHLFYERIIWNFWYSFNGTFTNYIEWIPKELVENLF